MARDKIYADFARGPNNTEGVMVSEAYYDRKKMRRIVEVQLVKVGVRLARILNEVLGRAGV
jgi:hypothetical protein